MQNLWRFARSITLRLAAAVASLFAIILAAFISQNYEKWAEEQGIDNLVSNSLPSGTKAALMTYLDRGIDYAMLVIDYLAGPFGVGFAIAACLFSIPDLVGLSKNKSANQERAMKISGWRKMILETQRDAYDHVVSINGCYSANNSVISEFIDNKLDTNPEYHELVAAFRKEMTASPE